jgi:SAM-dependent MidA family methyltransferase
MTSVLANIIATTIQKAPQQAITFAEFMEMVLYHPELGYYSSGQVEIGKQGDFFTASSLGSDFGELLANQLLQMQTILKIKPFQIVEMGAGKGHLAKDILDYIQQQHPEQSQNFEYIILEKSPALKQAQQDLLQTITDIKIRWCDWSELADQSIKGCFLSNELLDAFPVHKVTVQNSTLKELYVTHSIEKNSLFQEMPGKLSRSEIQTYFDNLGIDIWSYPEGFQTEVNLQMLDWLKQVQSKLNQGFILTIDYGYPATKYYHPQRYQGTLQCYFQHRHHNNPFVNLGQQDITAHVDFTTLQKQGEILGLQTLGLTQQGMFLMALGLGDRLNDLSQNPTDVMTLLKRREALHQLIDPMGLGGFYVLLQAKNLDENQAQIPLQGLSYS